MKKNKIIKGVNMTTLNQFKTSSMTSCVCHMVREMGDCRLSEVVKQVKQNKLW